MDVVQTLGERLARVPVFSRPSQNCECARAVPPLRDRRPRVEPRPGDPLGMEMTAAGQVKPAARARLRGSRPCARVESGIEVRIRQHAQEHVLVRRLRPRREQQYRPGPSGADCIRPGRGVGQHPGLHREAVAEPHETHPGLGGR